MKIKSFFLFSLTIFVFIGIFIGVGYGLSPIQGRVGEPMNFASLGEPINSQKLPDTLFYNWLKRSFSGSYVGILKIPVEPGQGYTLYIKLPIDGNDRGFAITGSYPEKSDGAMISFQGIEKSRGSYYKCNALARRINITISSESNSPLYIIFATTKPHISTTITLKYPKDPDSTVDKKVAYPGCNPNIKQYWGSIWKNPILLTKDPNLKEIQESKGNLIGTWITKDRPPSKLIIKKTEELYRISFRKGGKSFKGVGFFYKNTLIGTFLSKTNQEVGKFKILSQKETLILYTFSQNCKLTGKKVYIKE